MSEVPLLLECLGLKRLPRTGWVRCGVPHPESVAAHSWGVAWLVLMLLPAELDRGRALTYALLHDLPEVRVGDLTPHDGVDPTTKHRREDAAMASLLASRPELVSTWRAYEAQADDEARFVKQLDRLDMALQAVWYQRAEGISLDEFLTSAAKVIDHPVLVPVLEALRA